MVIISVRAAADPFFIIRAGIKSLVKLKMLWIKFWRTFDIDETTKCPHRVVQTKI